MAVPMAEYVTKAPAEFYIEDGKNEIADYLYGIEFVATKKVQTDRTENIQSIVSYMDDDIPC